MTSSPTPPTVATVTTVAQDAHRIGELVLALAWCGCSLLYLGYRWGLEDAARSAHLA